MEGEWTDKGRPLDKKGEDAGRGGGRRRSGMGGRGGKVEG
jgi:hypothetical protein